MGSKKTYKSQIKLKRTALGIVGAATLALSMIVPHSASAVNLRHHSVITDHTIKLGDIFDGLNGAALEHKAERILGAAPRPGEDMVLNARTLMRIAIALDLPWRPSSTADQIVLRRAATVVNRDMIEDSIKKSLAEEGLEGNYNILIPNDHAEIILPYGEDQRVEVMSFSYRPEYNRFDVELAAPSVANPVQRISLSGSVERLVKVPVLRDTLTNGSVIGVRDIDYIDMPESRVKHNIALNANEIIGMTPRRVLHPDKPINTGALEAPRIVQRGESVTMVFNHGGLVLTAQGKALEFGAKGDAIRVTNLSSSKTVEAIVTAEKEVSVASF